jgi:hypothetical protein
MDGASLVLNREKLLEGFFDYVFKPFRDPMLEMTLNQDYQRCMQGKQSFQEYYQEVSLLAVQLGLEMDTKELRERLVHNLAPYLREKMMGKRYKTVEQGVDYLLQFDREYRVLH